MLSTMSLDYVIGQGKCYTIQSVSTLYVSLYIELGTNVLVRTYNCNNGEIFFWWYLPLHCHNVCEFLQFIEI